MEWFSCSGSRSIPFALVVKDGACKAKTELLVCSLSFFSHGCLANPVVFDVEICLFGRRRQSLNMANSYVGVV